MKRTGWESKLGVKGLNVFLIYPKTLLQGNPSTIVWDQVIQVTEWGEKWERETGRERVG